MLEHVCPMGAVPVDPPATIICDIPDLAEPISVRRVNTAYLFSSIGLSTYHFAPMAAATGSQAA